MGSPRRRTIETELPDGRILTLAYDAAGNLASITPPGRPAHRFGHDALGQETDYLPLDIDDGTGAIAIGYNLDRQLTGAAHDQGPGLALDYDRDTLDGRPWRLRSPEGMDRGGMLLLMVT